MYSISLSLKLLSIVFFKCCPDLICFYFKLRSNGGCRPGVGGGWIQVLRPPLTPLTRPKYLTYQSMHRHWIQERHKKGEGGALPGGGIRRTHLILHTYMLRGHCLNTLNCGQCVLCHTLQFIHCIKIDK